MKEDRRLMRMNNGRIQVRGRDDEMPSDLETNLKYLRFCLNTEGGGVVLDWPVNLYLPEEHGSDTRLSSLPGTMKGTMNKSIQSFL